MDPITIPSLGARVTNVALLQNERESVSLFQNAARRWSSADSRLCDLSLRSQVMRETETQVKWPSKLKIGAKSKKGAHLILSDFNLFILRLLFLTLVLSP